ncbi:hypothetical protein [Salinisphaera sp. T31B1]|uniref:hypothetical protein n=1 Tax=Salinisphaera sp. T31B1 TaxID=727963 RepID=UPI003340D147
MSITPDQILMDAEVQAARWRRKRVGRDATVTFTLPDDDELRDLIAHRHQRCGPNHYRLVLLAIDDGEALDSDAGETSPAAGPYIADADRLRASGFLCDLRVAAALGSDSDYDAWVTRQRSIVSGEFSEVDAGGDGRCVACHVRRSGEAGTAFKPLYAQVPMTDDEHSRQHQGGEVAVYLRWARLAGITVQPSRAAAHAWFDERLIETRARWAEAQLCAALEVPALSHVEPIALHEWARDRDLVDLLPAEAVEGAPV